jgi:hypothetical protein
MKDAALTYLEPLATDAAIAAAIAMYGEEAEMSYGSAER